jgi:hypothetical protein
MMMAWGCPDHTSARPDPGEVATLLVALAGIAYWAVRLAPRLAARRLGGWR